MNIRRSTIHQRYPTKRLTNHQAARSPNIRGSRSRYSCSDTPIRASYVPGPAAASLIAHVLLGALHSEPVLHQLTSDGPARLTSAMRALACAVLDAPADPRLPAAAASS